MAVTQNLDTDEKKPMARIMLHILAALGELEPEMIRERVLTGLRYARAKGKLLGRPKRIFRRDKAIELHNQGKSSREVADILGIPVSTVYTIWRSKDLPGE